VNEIKTRGNLVSKGLIISLNHHQFEQILNENFAGNLVELNDILQMLARDYSLVQNPTVLNRMPMY
jgi:hypothetical protein